MQVGRGGRHSSPFVNGGHGGCQVIVILGDGRAVTRRWMGLGDMVSSGQGAVVVLGDGGAVTWRWMGAGDVATSGRGGPLMLCRITPTTWPIGHL